MTNTSKFKGVTDPGKDPHYSSDELEGPEDESTEDEVVEGEEDVKDKEAAGADNSESEDEVLPRFKGKSKKDISDAYANLEKEMGRQGTELGDLRKMAREWLFESESRNTKDNRKVDLTDEDFVEKPLDTVESVVEERLEPIRKELSEANRRVELANFLNKHPDHAQIASDPEFHAWVHSSPYRKKLFDKADRYDFDAADELYNLYKEQTATVIENKKRTEKSAALKKASSESSGAGSGSKGKKKIWSSAQLIRLKVVDPQKYQELQDEIMEAYAEGRVK